jgi:hypothetical protein
MPHWRQAADLRKRWIELTAVLMPTPRPFAKKNDPDQRRHRNQNDCVGND